MCSWDGLSAGAWEQSSGKSTVLQGSAWRWEAAGLARAMVQSQLCDFLMNQQIKGESRDLDGYLQVGCPALVIAHVCELLWAPAAMVPAVPLAGPWLLTCTSVLRAATLPLGSSLQTAPEMLLLSKSKD